MLTPGERVWVVTLFYYVDYSVDGDEVDVATEETASDVVGCASSAEAAAQLIAAHRAQRPLTVEDEDVEPTSHYGVTVVPGRSFVPHGTEAPYAEVQEGEAESYEGALRAIRESIPEDA